MFPATVEAEGLYVPEGPALLPDGRLAFVEQTAGRVSVYDGTAIRPLVETGGAPNAVAVGADQRLYICQNGGVVGPWRSALPRTPGIQRAEFDGAVESVTTTVDGRPLTSPNDLAFGPDGNLFFTDPAQPFDPDARLATGLVALLRPDGRAHEVWPAPGSYCNGIGFGADDELMWVESYTRAMCVLRDGHRTVLTILPGGHVPDGFAVAEDGRLFVATCGSHGIDVLAPTGDRLGFVVLDESANPTNCCFVGRELWVTDFGMQWFTADRPVGRLWRVSTDVAGLVVHQGVVTPESCQPSTAGGDANDH